MCGLPRSGEAGTAEEWLEVLEIQRTSEGMLWAGFEELPGCLGMSPPLCGRSGETEGRDPTEAGAVAMEMGRTVRSERICGEKA